MSTDGTPYKLIDIPRDSVEEAAGLLALAFQADPFITYLFPGPEYLHRATGLFRFICEARLELGWPLTGVARDGKIAGAACVSPPEKKNWPASLVQKYERLKSDASPETARKLDAFSVLSRKHAPGQSHYYLAVLGIHPEAQGKGLGRALLDAVHRRSESHPESSGVYLETAVPGNLSLYDHFGYKVVASEKLDGVVDFWYLFRPNPARTY